MFEALFRIVAQVESNEQGQRVVSTMYEQFLQQVDPSDIFTVTFRVQRP